MSHFASRDYPLSSPPPPPEGFRIAPGPDSVIIDGHYLHSASLPQHARCPHIQATGKCDGSCYGYCAGTGPFLCANPACLGHPGLWSSACFTRFRLQPRQRLPLSVLDDLRTTHPARLEWCLAGEAKTSRLTEDLEDDDRDPFVFRRAPRPPMVNYDNDWDNLLSTADQEFLASFLANAPRPRPTMQGTRAKAAPNWYEAKLTRAEEVEKMVEAIATRSPKRSGEQVRKAQEEKAFIAQMAAEFAKEERELTEQEDLYQLRNPSENPFPPRATSMEDLRARDAQIEARKRRVIAHEYRNSLVTSTTTPNIENPSKSSLDNPILDTALDQFLTQDPEKLESLLHKLGKLGHLAIVRADKLGLEGATDDDLYILKYTRASKRAWGPSFETHDSDDVESSALYQDQEPLSKPEGKRPVEECADAASARCQHHSCQPIRSGSRRSSTFSDTTSYGPLLKKSDAPAKDAGESEKSSPVRTMGFRGKSFKDCPFIHGEYFNWGDPQGPFLVLYAITNAVYELEYDKWIWAVKTFANIETVESSLGLCQITSSIKHI